MIALPWHIPSLSILPYLPERACFTCFTHMASLQEEILLIFVFWVKWNLKLSPHHCRLWIDLSCIWWENVFATGQGMRVVGEATFLHHGHVQHPVFDSHLQLTHSCSVCGPGWYLDLGALCTSSLRLAVGSKHSAAGVSSLWSVMSFPFFCFLLRPARRSPH